MSKVNRKMCTVVTVMISGDLLTETDTNDTEVTLLNVGHSMMATTVGLGDAEATTREFQQACAQALAKAGIQYLANELSGQHAEPPPPVTQPGASA